MRVGQTRRRDANEKDIRATFEAAGAYVLPVSVKGGPDLFVLYAGRWWAVEVKSKVGKLTAAQETLRLQLSQAIRVVRTREEARKLLGIEEKNPTRVDGERLCARTGSTAE